MGIFKKVKNLINQQVINANSINYISNINLFIDSNQFKFSYNPTFSANYIGGIMLSQHTPYVTGIGLYNDEGQLLAIAKTTFPIKLKYPVNLRFKITNTHNFLIRQQQSESS